MENLGGYSYFIKEDSIPNSSIEDVLRGSTHYADVLLIIDSRKIIETYTNIVNNISNVPNVKRVPIIKGLDIRGDLLLSIAAENYEKRSEKLQALPQNTYRIATAMGMLAYALEIEK